MWTWITTLRPQQQRDLSLIQHPSTTEEGHYMGHIILQSRHLISASIRYLQTTQRPKCCVQERQANCELSLRVHDVP